MQPERRRLYAAFLLILTIGLIILFATPGGPPASAQQIASPTAALVGTISATKVLADARDLNMTNGIIVGGVLLVLIIIGGTLNTLRQRPQH